MTKTSVSSSLQSLLDAMWADFITLAPQAARIHELFKEQGESIQNDHIALRTFGLPKVGIGVLCRPFLNAGYVERGRYEFPQKKLTARHYEHPDPSAPKIFISELLVAAFDRATQELITSLVEQIEPTMPARADFCTVGRPWTLSYQAYEQLRLASQYAAWVAAFGFRPNHFTVAVNAFARLNSLQQVNALLKEHGFKLNNEGGEIKGSPEQLLEQSSTMAFPVSVAFTDGSHRIPGCYYEFAKRYPRPDGTLYQGFVAPSADKIFESTR